VTERLFGTDGIRGQANTHPMTGEVMLELGRALALVFRLHPRGEHVPRVLIGKDTRRSGYMLEDALASGLCSMGVNVLQVGPIPTPGLAFLTVDMRCDAGAMISASHNPFQDNGVKFFSRDGFKLPDEVEDRIEHLMFSEEIRERLPTGARIGRARRIDDATGRYIVFLKKSFPKELTLEGLRIAVDCANGAAYRVGPTVLEELGAEVLPIATSPNGTNINDGCGAVHPKSISRAVRTYRADVGIALDGDADRVILADENGGLVDGDRILALCAFDLLERGALPGKRVVGTAWSNFGLEQALRDRGIELLRAAVGDRYVVEAMRREGLNLGGEQSGHVIFLEHNTTGDGVLTALQVLAILCRKGRPLSELASVMTPLPQIERSVRVRTKPPIDEMPDVARLIEQIEKRLGEEGRMVVRYSGTEPLARVMLEGPDPDHIEGFAEEVCELIRAKIGEET
jgi:phosphoglucosamine mutase